MRRAVLRLALFAAVALLTRAPFLTSSCRRLRSQARCPAAGGAGRAPTSRLRHWDLLIQDLETRPPAFVLDTAPSGLHGWDRYPMEDFPRLDAFVRSGYRAIADVDGVWIWRRKGCESGVADE